MNYLQGPMEVKAGMLVLVTGRCLERFWKIERG